MSDTVLQFQFKVGGVLTNATSIVLSDAAGTFGVKRTDTSATIVAAGTAMTNASTGVYRYTLTLADQSVPLSWWVTAVYNGVTYRFERASVSAAAAGPTPLQQAQTTLSNLYALAASANWASGIASTMVDGQSVTFRGPADLQTSIEWWQKQVALLSGARRRVCTVRTGF
jgi:hypothetical protein